jgi:hypothetical protein
MPKTLLPTRRQLDAALRFWTRLLRLQDWTIEVRFCRCYDINAGGCVAITPKRKVAIIKIAEPADHEHPLDHDWESTLIHELLHIHLEGWDVEDDSADDVDKEQSTDLIARALLTLKRKKD